MESSSHRRRQLQSLRRTNRSNRLAVVYNSETNQWIPQELIEEVLVNEQHMDQLEENLEMLEASSAHQSTQIRPFSRSGQRQSRHYARPLYETSSQIQVSRVQQEEELLQQMHEQSEEVQYIRDLQAQRALRRNLLRQAIERGEESRVMLLEDRDDEQDDEQVYSEAITAKSIEEYKEFIPECWSEVLERDNQISVSILESYGPLALLVYTRLMRLSQECEEMRELRVIAVITAAQAQGNKHGINEIKFMQKILEFYNFNVSLAKRDVACRQRLELLIDIIPSFKQLRKVFKQHASDSNELVIYKIIIDIMDRYLNDFDSASMRRYRKRLIPFAMQFYNKLNPNNIKCLQKHIEFFKPYYSKFVMFDTKEEFLEHYEGRLVQLDNMCRFNTDCNNIYL